MIRSRLPIYFYLIIIAFVSASFSFKDTNKNPWKIGVTTSISNSDLLKRSGYSYIEEGVGTFLMPSKDDQEFFKYQDVIKRSSLPVEVCNLFLPGNLKSVGPHADPEKIVDYARITFARAQMAGVSLIVFGSGGSRRVPEGYPYEKAKVQFIDLCSQLADVAMEYGVTIVLETLNKQECNFINSLAEGAEIVEAVNHQNFKLHADIYHMLMENERASEIQKYGNLILHVHIAEKKNRAAPGTMNEDFSDYFKALRLIGYKGRISIECNWQNMEDQNLNAIRTLTKQIDNVFRQ